MFPAKRYGLIYADPAWLMRDPCTSGRRGSIFKYQCMPLTEMMQLPVPDIAADNCLLAMWWLSSMPGEAILLAEAWGFKVKHMTGFVWHKKTTRGNDHFGMGSYTRAGAESCLFGVRGKFSRASASVRQVISAPVGRHSEKPNEARLRLEKLVGDVPKIELFARTRHPGWEAWGNELS